MGKTSWTFCKNMFIVLTEGITDICRPVNRYRIGSSYRNDDCCFLRRNGEIWTLKAKRTLDYPQMKAVRSGGQPERTAFPVWILTGSACCSAMEIPAAPRHFHKCSYPDLQALTPAVLHDLVNKMYVCAPGKRSGHQAQDVNISPAYIGFPPQGILSETANHAAKSRTA